MKSLLNSRGINASARNSIIWKSCNKPEEATCYGSNFSWKPPLVKDPAYIYMYMWTGNDIQEMRVIILLDIGIDM